MTQPIVGQTIVFRRLPSVRFVGQTIVFRRLPSVRFVGQTIVFRRLPSAPNRQTTKYDGLPHRAESGYAMLLVFLMAALIAIALYSELPRVAFEAQRTKEQLLIERGEQYKRAIQLFVRKMSRYPATIEELENTNNVRFLRKRYIDPMTGKDKWRLIHINGGVLTDSIVPKQNPNAPPGQQGDQPPQNTNTFIGEGPVMGAGNDPNQQQINPALRRRASDDRPTVEQEAANNPQQDADNSDDNADNAADNNDNNNNGDDNPAPGAPNANANVPGAQNPNTPGFPGRIPQPGMQNGTFPGQPGFNPALANQNLGQPGMPTPGINPGFPGAGNTTNNGQSSDPSSSSGVYAAPSLGSSAANATPTPTYPGQPGGFPGQPGFQNQPGGFPGRPGMFPGQPGGFPGQPGAFPGQGGGIQSGGFQSGGGLQSGGFNPGQTAGGINPQAGQNNAFSNNFGLNGPSNIQQNAPGGMGGTQMGGGSPASPANSKAQPSRSTTIARSITNGNSCTTKARTRAWQESNAAAARPALPPDKWAACRPDRDSPAQPSAVTPMARPSVATPTAPHSAAAGLPSAAPAVRPLAAPVVRPSAANSPASASHNRSNPNHSPSSLKTNPPATDHRSLATALPRLRRPHLPLVHPKIVRHLVPHRAFHHPPQVRFPPRQPLMRALEDRDPVRHREALEYAAPCQRPPLVKAQQSAARAHARLRQLRRRRLRLHHHRHVLHPLPELARNPAVSLLHKLIEFIGIHRCLLF